jgi:hypothetical protein
MNLIAARRDRNARDVTTHPTRGEAAMIRKLTFAFAAIAALSAGALATTATPAAAKKFGKHFGHHHIHGHFWRHGYGFYAADLTTYDCLRRVWVVNRFGEVVRRTVNVCE